ncbi:hypothetical protein [Azoarcus sp. KH32C]|uniref:hypothetical protein n=1 Tax=Azoarcus sp. KH32C TaxID=748247 RepID=UPI0002385EA4|nr:hypothetical protein [Azoarcus sp. KH32C]BAL23463.1 hypothetical protein AZKH_1134 [Azoarcus sp. KH32C]
MADGTLGPLSLIQHFDAPTEYRGAFGWMCGYSADPAFLNEAMERFTRETVGQRAHRGQVSLALLLDPGCPAIGPVEVPGLAHLPLQGPAQPPFRLLHAKVALLGFRHESGDGRWRLRLIVSTGNWTRQTVEESLDLAWCIEVSSDEVDPDYSADNEDVQQRCADVKAAWSMLEFLHSLFDLRLLDAGQELLCRETVVTRAALAGWVARCAACAGQQPRFVDNRHQALLEQLVPRVQGLAGGRRRNYLAMGSGFFEGASAPPSGAVPAVLKAIVERLRLAGLLSKTSTEIDVFVNPAACQAVAGAGTVAAMLDEGWSVRPAARMETVFGPHSQRSLHAKFIFSACSQDNSAACNSAWVYLGSGNLTEPGLCNTMSPYGGNLEAGVIFAPEGLEWNQQAKRDPRNVVTNLLPLQWDIKFAPNAVLGVGAAMPLAGDAFLAPPVAWLTWIPAEIGGVLQAAAPLEPDVSVLDVSGNPYARVPEGFRWLGHKPRQVRLCWQHAGRARECLVPVMDEFGRLAATELEALDFDEAWWALVGFPAAPNEDAAAPDDAESNDPAAGGGTASSGGVTGYPVRQMMELIENIAAKQTTIARADWPAWCARLEQTLAQIADSPVVTYFQTLDLNPLSPLRIAAFRPDFAEAQTKSEESRAYESVLDRVEEKWNTGDLSSIGGGKQ